MLHGAHSVSLLGGVVVMGCGTNSEVMGSIHTCFSLKVQTKIVCPRPIPISFSKHNGTYKKKGGQICPSISGLAHKFMVREVTVEKGQFVFIIKLEAGQRREHLWLAVSVCMSPSWITSSLPGPADDHVDLCVVFRCVADGSVSGNRDVR